MIRALILLLICWTAAACSVDSGANPGRRCNTDVDCGNGTCYRGFCLPADASTNVFPDADVRDIGMVDGGEACTEENTTRVCYSGRPGSDGFGPCHGGEQECRGGFWGRCIGEVLPMDQEIDCNGIDDDCDDITDELNTAPCPTGQRGVCAMGVEVCMGNLRICTATITASDEVCNNKDDDCDGDTDEDVVAACFTGAFGCTSSGDGKFECDGLCSPGQATCTMGQFGECVGEVLPGVMEICDAIMGNLALDDDCDEAVDENCACTDDTAYPCYTGPAGTSTVPPCQPGSAICRSNNLGVCMNEITPVVEACDNEGADDDCDGTPDDIVGRNATCTTTAAGICQDGTTACVNGVLTCVTPTPTTETCNGLDDNCDGEMDEDFLFLTDELHCGGCNRPCAEGLDCCAGECIDRTSDPDNCSACGIDCGEDRLCCNSMCADRLTDENNCNTCGNACPMNFSCCNAACVDTRTDEQACGDCQTACTAADTSCCNSACAPDTSPACTGCAMTCAGNETCCAPINPICTDRMTDPNNCGVCGRMCTNGQLCCGGNCVANDTPNCGMCNNTCTAGMERCCNGTCTDINATNCAGCGDVCMGGEACCVTGCETTTTDDEANCGGCGITCPPMRPNCSAGSCCPGTQVGCGAPSGAGGMNCRNLNNDDDNCGMCFNACSGLWPNCNNGRCCGLLGCL